jgi:glycine/D-amino acid oxidase-like deaminating enzyme
MVQTHKFIQEHQIDCESRRLDTVDIIYDRDQWNEAQESVALMRHLMGDDDPAAKYEFCDAEETARRFLTPGAIGSVTYEAGSLSAYRLVIGILNLALARGLNLQCNTAATSVCRAHLRDQEAVWSVTTPRGVINARKIILATNGYTAHLYPKLQGVIVPLRGFVTAQRPGKAMPAAGLSNTYSFIYSEGYEYMIPRPQETKFAGDIVIGGGLTKVSSLHDLQFTRICRFISEFHDNLNSSYHGFHCFRLSESHR